MSRIKSKILSYFLSFVLLVGLLPAWTVTASAVWDGTAADIGWYTDNPAASSFTIGTEDELAGLAALVNAGTNNINYDETGLMNPVGADSIKGTDFAGKTITLSADLDLGTDKTWTPIGTGTPYTAQRHPFQGTFDGGGFTVSGTVTASGSSSADASGLFGYVGTNAFIKNLKVNLNVTYNYTSGGTYIGALAGYNLGTLINCASAGSVKADKIFYCVFAGGLVGYNDGTVLHCSSTATVLSDAENNYSVAGGLAGQCWYQSVILDSYAAGAVNAYGEGSQTGIFAGGFVGYNAGTVKNSYCTQATITNSQAEGGYCTYVGGFAGQNNSTTGILLNAYYNSAYTGAGIGNINGAKVNDARGISAALMTGSDTGTVDYHTGYFQASIYQNADYTDYTSSADSFVGALNAGSSALLFSNSSVWAADSGSVNGGYPVLANYVYATELDVQGAGGAETITTEGGTLQLSAEASSSTYSLVSWSVVSGDCGTLSKSGLLKAKYNGEITVRAAALENSAVYCDKTITVSGLPDNWQESGAAAAAFDGGDGSQHNPYQIKTAGQLAFLAKTVNAGTNYSGKYIVLTDDISLSGRQWMPIGWYDVIYDRNYEFNGNFSGAGHQITGLTIGSSDAPVTTLKYAGLFGRTNGGSVSDTGVEAQIYTASGVSNQSYAGSLAGHVTGTTISNCHVSGSITDSNAGSAYVGGLAGYVDDAEVSNCIADANITADGTDSNAGGLIGCLGYYDPCTVTASHSSGNVTATGSNSSVGGFAGEIMGNVSNSYATGFVSAGDNSSTGGFTGLSRATVRDSFASGSVSAGDAVGENRKSYVGGFAGQNWSEVLNCYASGNVTAGASVDSGAAFAGGFTGYNIYLGDDATGTIKNCYAAGSVSGESGTLTGGFAGFNGKGSADLTTYGTLINDYYDKTKNAGAAVGQDDASGSYVAGLTTEEMNGTDTSAGTLIDALNVGRALCGNPGDFAIWAAGTGGYPEFQKYWKDYTESFAGGDGTEDAPYQIATAGQLAYLAKLINEGTGFYGLACYKLTADINLSGKQWTPIALNNPFAGTFNGNGHTVSGLAIGSADAPNSTLTNTGLFSWLDVNAVVENVGVINASIYSSREGVYAGILTATNEGTIRDSYTSGTIVTSGSGYSDSPILSGGFVVYNYGTIQNCYSTCNVTATGDYSRAGGFVGINYYYDSDYPAVIENCYAAGGVTVTGQYSFSGGFVCGNESEETEIFGTLKNDYYNSTLNTGGGVSHDEASDSHVVGLTTAQMKDAASTIIYYTSGSDTVGTTANTLTAALNGGRTLLGTGYAYKSWKINSSANNGYPVLYTPSPSGDVPYSDDSSGGSASGNSSGGGKVDTTTTEGTTTVTTTVTASAGANGAASAAVTEAQIGDAISRAAEQASSQGADRQVVEISVSEANTATAVSATIPRTAFGALANSSADALVVRTSVGTVSLDATALDTINKSAAGDVTLTIAQADTASMTEEQREAIGGRPVYDLTVTSGGSTISGFGGGAATVSIPYTPAPGENPSNVVIYYLSDSGELVMVPNCVYDASTSSVTFRTSHFSQYAVGYHEVSFTDVSGWYKDYVEYLAARKIVSGSGNGAFSPDSDITRAEFVTILAKLSGSELGKYNTSAFTDVSTTDWFCQAVQWANENGIAFGSDGKFNPNANITRQDIAVMITRYADKVAAYALPETNSAAVFTDGSEIDAYATDAVKAMQRAGIISGNPDGSFEPTGNATRAQAAKMIALLLQSILG